MARSSQRAALSTEDQSSRERLPVVAAGAKRLHAIRQEFARFIEMTGLANTPESAVLFAKERRQHFALSESQIIMALHGRLPFGYKK